MLYKYTVTLQSKQGPRRYTTKAKDISEVIQRIKNTLLRQYTIRSIVRKPL